jgi:tight adherence protein B
VNLAARRTAALRPDASATHRSCNLSAASAALGRLATRWATRREAHDAAELAAVLDTVSRRCSSGESLGVALGAALQPGTALTEVAIVLHHGGTVHDALEAVQSTNPDIILAVHVLALCAEQGGNVSESLDRAAATLRERHGVRLERRAHSAQARLSARVLTVVPIAFASWTLATTPTVRAFTVTPAGLACLALGAAANVAGWRLMARAIRSTE